ncbi:hypothetical protein C8R46DRAFT_952925, partial [Mycena filopes]
MAPSNTNNNINSNSNNASAVPSSSTFSFKAPLLPASATAASSSSSVSLASGAASPDASAAPQTQKQRRVSLALPSSPRVVPAWNFRDDTTVPYAARKGKVRRIDTAASPEDGVEEDDGGEGDDRGRGEDGGGLVPPEREKKVRRKWTPAETQMLVDGCTKHGVGNWKAILSDPALTFAGRSPVDLKDRFRTYFPEAYRTHYPNARTHLPPALARATSPSGRRPFTPEEDSALLAGFRKHGAAWAAIAKEAPVFGVTGRRSMDLRDRFRNAWPGEY